MIIIDHNNQPLEEWREGVTTRMRVSAMTGSLQLTIFDQLCAPNMGAPTHQHTVEEVLSVLEGEAVVWLEEEYRSVGAGQSVLIPARHRHGFRNSGTDKLLVQAILAAPIFEAIYDDRAELSRRWVPKPAKNE